MRRTAFTLIELIVTIAIIAILTGIATISYTGIQARGRDSQRKNDLSQLKIVLSSYYTAQVPQQYVASPAQAILNNNNDPLFTALVPNYIKKIPLDPLNSGVEVYKYQSYLTNDVNKDYKLFATLENRNDQKGWINGSWAQDGFILQNE